MKKLGKGVYLCEWGERDNFSPFTLLGTQPKEDKRADAECPFSEKELVFEEKEDGVLLSLPVSEDEDFYGLGLMFKKVRQTGRQLHLRVNSDPIANTGDSHAPVPFFVSTKGYGVLVLTAREATFSFCNAIQKRRRSALGENRIVTDVNALYLSDNRGSDVRIFLRGAKGISIVIFAGENTLDAVERYNLFCGGGALPALYGLGILYRCFGGADEKAVLDTAQTFRKEGVPCDMIGLEPGWQTYTYSNSLCVNRKLFPDFYGMVKKLREQNFHVNLWEHAFLHNSCPLYDELFDKSGDYEVWQGIVPDFSLEEVRRTYAEYHEREFLSAGIDDFKVDECDSSDYSTNWSFPPYAKFPGGTNGEQMHQLLGTLLAKTFHDRKKTDNKRYFSQIRSLGAGASPYSFALYSDLYAHKDFVRGIINASFSGLLWTPEVRQCESERELLRRLETLVFSPFVCVNSWMIPSPPWQQWDCEKNNRGELLENREELTKKCRDILSLRMRFLPYLYAKYFEYALHGTPVFRAMPLAYPQDLRFRDCEDEYMLGEDILIAPIDADTNAQRKVIFPAGEWIGFFDHKVYAGEATIGGEMPIGVYVKRGALLPLAQAAENTDAKPVPVTVYAFGASEGETVLYEDDGESFDYESGKYNVLKITYRNGKIQTKSEGKFGGKLWEIAGAEEINV